MAASLINAFELGLISSLTVLSLYISYTMLNVCDLSTDGSFTMGAAVGAIVAISGHPYLAIFAAVGSGMLSGFVTAFLQTKMGVDSLLAGIVVNTGLYSINIAIMGGSSLLNMNTTQTIFTDFKDLLGDTFIGSYTKLVVILLVVIIVVTLIGYFMKTRIGLSIRATGNNPDMVKSSSINTNVMTIVGLCLSNGLTALSGCLLGMYNKSVNIDIGTGMLTVALASLLIGRLFFRKRIGIITVISSVLGAVIFRIVYSLALKLNMPAYLLKLISSVIVIIAIAGPYFVGKIRDRINRKKGKAAAFGKEEA